MKRAHHLRRDTPLVLHNINFSGSRPTAIDRIPRHEPEGRPVAFALRQFSEFESAVALAEQALRLEFGRCIAQKSGNSPFLPPRAAGRLRHRHSWADWCSTAARYCPAPVAVADIELPLGRINARPVKLVAPNHLPAGESRAGRGQKTKSQQPSETNSLGCCSKSSHFFASVAFAVRSIVRQNAVEPRAGTDRLGEGFDSAISEDGRVRLPVACAGRLPA